MDVSLISFFSEDIDFVLNQTEKLQHWILQVIENEDFKLSEINYIFCSDDYLLNINQEYLNHDTYTDIITFDNSEVEGIIEGDIFISIDRVRENAQTFQVSFEDELHRVMIHGVLHLCGYLDKSAEDQKQMREQENICLSLLDNSAY